MAIMKHTVSADHIPSIVFDSYFAAERLPPLFVGSPGIGKTYFIRDAAGRIAERLTVEQGAPISVPVVEFHAAAYSEVDAVGYLIPAGEVAKFTLPAWWGEVASSEYGILFIDEWSQASHEMQKVLAPLLYEGRIGPHYLPRGWRVVLAGNELDDNAGANTMLSHVINRVMVVHVTAPSVESWVSWAAGKGIAPEIMAFAKLRPNVVFDAERPADDQSPYCTPRSLAALSFACNHDPVALAAKPYGRAVIAGTIGDGAAVELLAIMERASRLPTAEEIRRSPDTALVPSTLPDQYAAVMLATMRLALPDSAADRTAYVTYLLRFDLSLVLVGLIASVARTSTVLNDSNVAKFLAKHHDEVGRYAKYIKVP